MVFSLLAGLVAVVTVDAVVGDQAAVAIELDGIGGEDVGGTWEARELDNLQDDAPTLGSAREAGGGFGGVTSELLELLPGEPDDLAAAETGGGRPLRAFTSFVLVAISAGTGRALARLGR